ncbi:MAG: ATP synthase F1 subunit delta [Candidatus Methylomirabilales bacterium]
MPRLLAKRLGRMLAEVAAEAGSLERTGEELGRITEVLQVGGDAAAFLQNPRIPLQEKTTALEVIARRQRWSALIRRFLRMLLERRRIRLLSEVVEFYRQAMDERLGRVRARVTTATGLKPRQVAGLRASLETRLERTVLLEEGIDPAILGGLVVQVGGTIYDGSIRSQLKRLQTYLTKE